jgi:hypothetical protein
MRPPRRFFTGRTAADATQAAAGLAGAASTRPLPEREGARALRRGGRARGAEDGHCTYRPTATFCSHSRPNAGAAGARRLAGPAARVGQGSRSTISPSAGG